MRFLKRAALRFSEFALDAAHVARYVMLHFFARHKEVHGVRVILERKGRVVLVRHWYAPGAWTLPGGLVEPLEDDESAARREVFEETGYTLNSIEGVVGTYEGSLGAHDTVRVVYSSDYDGGLKLLPNLEIMERGIFDLDNLPDTVSPANRRRIEAYARGVRDERGHW